jgi:hypothetical protein
MAVAGTAPRRAHEHQPVATAYRRARRRTRARAFGACLRPADEAAARAGAGQQLGLPGRLAGATMVPVTRPSFYNWQKETEIQAAYEWLFEGLFFDVEHANLWPQSWVIKTHDRRGTESPPARTAARRPQTDPRHRTSLSAGRTMRRGQSGPVHLPVRYDYLRQWLA